MAPTRPAGNALHLGPHTRRVIRSVARLVNPLVLRIAGRRHMPVVGIIHHRGRKTGRPYATPLGIRPATANGFVMPLTFGESAGWYRNIVAAGSCVITWRGADHTVASPVIVDRATALPAFPPVRAPSASGDRDQRVRLAPRRAVLTQKRHHQPTPVTPPAGGAVYQPGGMFAMASWAADGLARPTAPKTD
jgi:deazaflavin-dependent oxidoreductase (nitroreductase family)